MKVLLSRTWQRAPARCKVLQGLRLGVGGKKEPPLAVPHLHMAHDPKKGNLHFCSALPAKRGASPPPYISMIPYSLYRYQDSLGLGG